MPTAGINSEDVKKQNRGLALRLIIREGACTRPFLVAQSGLSRMTVSNIVTALIEDGYVTETEEALPPEKGKPGKKPVLLRLADTAPRVMGVYISREQLVVGVARPDCRFEKKEVLAWGSETKESITKKLGDAVSRVQKACRHRLLGVGVAALGPLQPQEGAMLAPPAFFGVDYLDVAGIITKATGLAVKLLNDMDAAALAERMFGRGKRTADFVYVGISNGVGAGIITGGQLYQQGLRHGGEIGHISICFDGPLCPCGNKGCLEVYVGMPVLLDKLNRALGNGRVLTPADLPALYGDARFGGVFAQYRARLAVGLANVCNALDPDMIVLGHEANFLPGLFFSALEGEMNRLLFNKKQQLTRVLPAAFGVESPLAGGICAVLEDLFAGALY